MVGSFRSVVDLSPTRKTAGTAQTHRRRANPLPRRAGGGRACARRVRRFCSRRRWREALVGRVGRRRRGTASPAAIFSARRCSASSRLRDWPRASWATAVTAAPARASRRSRCTSSSAAERSTSKTASTREAVTLACWPPGPEERLVRSSISASGIASAVVDPQLLGHDYPASSGMWRSTCSVSVCRTQRWVSASAIR